MDVERCCLCRRRLGLNADASAKWFLEDGRTVHLKCLQREALRLEHVGPNEKPLEPEKAKKQRA